MSARPPDEPDDDGQAERFEDAMSDVRRLVDRDRRIARGPRRTGAGPGETTVVFDRPDPEEPGLGVAEGLQSRQLQRLRSGRIRPDRSLDLHRLDAIDARRILREQLLSAREAGERCVLVVHGRGLGSEDGPVLKPALPSWLGEPPLGAFVLAFAPARPPDGGAGATYVLLRRRRRG